MNKDLKGTVHANRGVENQVCRIISRKSSEKILSNNLVLSFRAERFSQKLRNPNFIKNSVVIDGVRMFGVCSPLVATADEERLCVQNGLDPECCVLYTKARFDGCVYSSTEKAKTNNSVAKLKDGRLVKIQKIVVDETLDRVVFFVSELRTEPLCQLRFRQLTPKVRAVIHIADEVICIKKNDIEIVAFYSKCANRTVVVPFPNVYNTF